MDLNMTLFAQSAAIRPIVMVYDRTVEITPMIKLRLKRFGKKNQSSFRLVAVNSTSRRDGKPLKELGFYNPNTKVSNLNIEEIRQRINTGAQPTDTVKSILIKAGVIPAK